MEDSSDASGNHSIDENKLDVASLLEVEEVSQQWHYTVKETPHPQELSTIFQKLTAQEEDPWNIIIVNQIPKSAVREEIISLFSEYGAITDVHVPETKWDGWYDTSKLRGFAQLTFKNEADAQRVWEVSQKEGIRYTNGTKSYVMMITLASQNYTPIDNLPDDCLREIFLHLFSLEYKIVLEFVCKRWQKVARESWSNVTKIEDRSGPNFSWKVILPRAGKYLRMMRMTLCRDSLEDLSLSIEYCENLEKLDITLPNNFMPFLPSLNLFLRRNERLRCFSVNFDGVSRVSYKHNSILDISFMQHLPATLQEIYLRRGVCDCRYPIAPLELSRFQNLQVLEIVEIPIGEDHLRGIETLQNLKELTLRDCGVHPSNVERIIGLTKLESVYISECRMTDSILSQIAENNKGLKNLEITEEGDWERHGYWGDEPPDYDSFFC